VGRDAASERHHCRNTNVGGHNRTEMRIVLILLLTLGTIQSSVGQVDSIKQSDLDSLYVRTIRNQIYLALSSGYKYFEITSNTDRIKDKVGITIFKFLTHEELIDKSIKEKKSILVYRVVHKIISSDTVDINIGDVSVTAKRSIHFNHGLRTKKANFAISCGGTNGYIPTERFAFNRETRTWDQIEFVKPKNYRDRLNNN
jgi:hypothetical protein